MLVCACGILLPALWIALNRHLLFGTQNGLIRGVLSIAFAVLILLRPKPGTDDGDDTRHARPPVGGIPHPVLAVLVAIGAALAATGILVPIHHAAWLGVLCLTVACLAWALPARLHRDTLASLLVLYWAAPMPTRFFEWLQLGMQRLSVDGSAWFLHLINGRVWADDLILYTPVHVFEVPAWCSGMRTATTVLILTIALSILKRLPAAVGAMLALLALVHALLLNVLRISTMVIFSRSTGSDAGIQFLHDSASVIVIVAVFLVYAEVEIARHTIARRRIVAGDTYPDQIKVLSQYPPFWRRLIERRVALFGGLALVLLAGALIYRSRPYHRAMMIKDVATGLRDIGKLEEAQRCAEEVQRLVPDDTEWRFTVVRLLLIRGRHQQVLDELDALDREGFSAHHLQTRVLRAYALMSIGRIEDAGAIVASLPEDLRRHDPRVAMVLAEMALRGNNVEDVAVHVVTASGWMPNAGRIRNLYPYLRVHRKWQAIADSDIPIPYANPVQAYSLLEAYMNLDNVPRVAAIATECAERWPADPRVLEPLYFMALKREGGEWEDRFAQHLYRAVRAMDSPDRLYELLYKCAQLSRPDLLWTVHERIRQIDASHPALGMAVAVYGNRWFQYRKRRLGIAAGSASETLDLRPFYLFARLSPHWTPLTRLVPHGDALAPEDILESRKEFLRRALREFEARQHRGELSIDMQYLYVRALEMGDEVDGARAELAEIVSRHPEEREAARVVLSEVYERQADWVNVYETLRDYLAPDARSMPPAALSNALAESWAPLDNRPSTMHGVHLLPLLRLGRAQIELRLGVAALYTTREAVKRYPYATQARAMQARAAAAYGSPEEALFLLSQPRVRNQQDLDMLEARALYDSERYNEVESFCRKHAIPVLQVPPGLVQQVNLPPAELSVLWHQVALPSEPELADTAATIRGNLAGTPSPALRAMMQNWLRAYAEGCKGPLASPDTWEALGRDRVEKAIALNQLTLLLCREERFSEALVAARRAIVHLPEVSLLHRIAVGLSGADRLTITDARLACPDDPELWLAELVARTQLPRDDGIFRVVPDEGVRVWVRESVSRAAREQVFPPGTLVRAGEYLYRGNLKDEAAIAARDGTRRARGLLPAFVLGIRCALHSRDEAWALNCTEEAIRASLRPMPDFYEQLVRLRIADGDIDTDPDMVNALRQLRKAYPENPLWAQMLGYIRFRRGGWEIIDALFEMNAAIEGGATNRVPYVVAAEVSRMLKNYDRAADLLRRGLEAHPGNEVMINNLAYTLAQDATRVGEAVKLLPQLEILAGDNLRIVDTLAVIYIRTGDYAKARQAVTRIFQGAVPGSPRWFRARMHLAEIAWREGDAKQAADIVNQILQNSRGVPDEDVLEANALLGKILGAEESR